MAKQTILPSCSISINLIISGPSSLDEYVSNALTAMTAPVLWFKTNAIIPRTCCLSIFDTLEKRKLCQQSICREISNFAV